MDLFAFGALDLTTTCVRVVLTDATILTVDIVTLLRKWIIEPDTLAQTAARPEWLLDGWDRMAALWETAITHMGQEAALVDISNLIPVVPREVGAWIGHQLNVDPDLQRHRKKVVFLEDWRTGPNVIDLIGRNEALLERTA